MQGIRQDFRHFYRRSFVHRTKGIQISHFIVSLRKMEGLYWIIAGHLYSRCASSLRHFAGILYSWTVVNDGRATVSMRFIFNNARSDIPSVVYKSLGRLCLFYSFLGSSPGSPCPMFTARTEIFSPLFFSFTFASFVSVLVL